jgi:hypothetical protein
LTLFIPEHSRPAQNEPACNLKYPKQIRCPPSSRFRDKGDPRLLSVYPGKLGQIKPPCETPPARHTRSHAPQTQ